MRRLIGVLALAAALIAGSTASANAAAVYDGFFRGAPESDLKLRFVKHDGKRYLDFLRYERVRATCDDGSPTQLFGERSFGRREVRVRRGRFEFAQESSPDDIFRIAGTLIKGQQKAEGTFRYRGEVDGRGVCDTGRLEWVTYRTS